MTHRLISTSEFVDLSNVSEQTFFVYVKMLRKANGLKSRHYQNRKLWIADL